MSGTEDNITVKKAAKFKKNFKTLLKNSAGSDYTAETYHPVS